MIDIVSSTPINNFMDSPIISQTAQGMGHLPENNFNHICFSKFTPSLSRIEELEEIAPLLNDSLFDNNQIESSNNSYINNNSCRSSINFEDSLELNNTTPTLDHIRIPSTRDTITNDNILHNNISQTPYTNNPTKTTKNTDSLKKWKSKSFSNLYEMENLNLSNNKNIRASLNKLTKVNSKYPPNIYLSNSTYKILRSLNLEDTINNLGKTCSIKNSIPSITSITSISSKSSTKSIKFK